MVVILSLLLIGLVLYLFFLKREIRLLTTSVRNIQQHQNMAVVFLILFMNLI